MNIDIDRLRRAVGHTHECIDPRIDLPRLIDTDRTVPRPLSPTAGHNRGTARRPEGAPPSTLGASRQRIQRDLEGRL